MEESGCFKFFFFSLVFTRRGKGKRLILAFKLHQHSGIWGWSFDDSLETPIQDRAFQGCYSSSFDRSEKLLVSLLHG